MFNESIHREFKRYLDQNLKSVTELRLSGLSEKQQKEYAKREAELHPSSFPFCPLRNVYERLIREPDPVVYVDFRGEYYTNVGHVTHGLLQQYLGLGGKLLANWKCLECSHVHRFTSHVAECVKCKSPKVAYSEIGGRFGHVRWHKDGIFKSKDSSLWVVDFKTSYSMAISKYNSKGIGLPHNTNVAQVECYIPLVEDRLKIKVAGWILAYFARDYPVSSQAIVVKKCSDSYREKLRERLDSSNKLFGLGLAPDKNLSVMVKNKLCENRDYYENHVYESWNPCPLEKVCFNRVKLKAEIKKVVRVYRSNKDGKETQD